MRTLTFFLFLALGIMSGKALAQDIETESVDIDNLIDFIAQNYPHQAEDDLDFYNFTFALQVPDSDLNIENKFILKQAFKLLSDRLTDDSTISIITYYGNNGMALDRVSVKNLDQIFNVIENLKDAVIEPKDDGITVAYQHSKNIFDEDANNVVFIIRNEDATLLNEISLSEKEMKKLKRKKRNKAILKTAVTLLPEIIAIIDK